LLTLSGSAHVRWHEKARQAQSGNRITRGLAGGDIAFGDHDKRAFPREQIDAGPTEARAAAGDQCDLAGKSHGLSSSSR
jgi:hypothetical protein